MQIIDTTWLNINAQYDIHVWLKVWSDKTLFFGYIKLKKEWTSWFKCYPW
jgi:hypothetical protein